MELPELSDVEAEALAAAAGAVTELLAVEQVAQAALGALARMAP